METGTKISLVAHGTLLGIIVIAGPLFDSSEPKVIRVSDVSMISSAEFEALSSRSPGTVAQLPEPRQPSPQTEAAVVPPVAQTPPAPASPPTVEAPENPDAMPDLTALKVPEQPELFVQSPNLEDQANPSVGSSLELPDSAVSDRDSAGQKRPDILALVQPKLRPAPRVDTTAAEKPAIDAAPAPEVSKSTTPDAAATQQVREAQETAPLEASTEIVTEPEADPNAAAPLKSSRPQGRPRDLAAKTQKAKDKAKVAARLAAAVKAQAQKEAQAKAIEAALLEVTSEPEPVRASGPPLTASERNGLVLAVEKCWNVPVGLQNAADLVVVLSVELTPQGKLSGNPVLIEPKGTLRATTQRAFEAGRRALIRCAPYDLPADKYEQWRQLEVVFNPRKMVVK